MRVHFAGRKYAKYKFKRSIEAKQGKNQVEGLITSLVSGRISVPDYCNLQASHNAYLARFTAKLCRMR